ncbi:MAG: citramalate synthase [Armatimonadota bacterium]
MQNRVEIYDTTLRDGTQGEFINMSIQDKLRIAKRLDEFGVDFIEGGWPASNPKDTEFFERAKTMVWHTAKISAFGSTQRPKLRAEDDVNLQQLVASEAPVITIFGKCWDLHVLKALKIEMPENIDLIFNSIDYLHTHCSDVNFDAEHFFDGYKDNPDYAIDCLFAAKKAGAQRVVLCDTNGGTLPGEISDIVKHVIAKLQMPVGIHAHNDSECAVANSLVAIQAGCCHVQGTMNGMGERAGNANLCSIIPALRLKLGKECLKDDSMVHLTSLSTFVDEIINQPHYSRQPYVGKSAFAHKGGVHVDAIMKNSRTYEHIQPEAVGNTRRILVSELAGGSTVVQQAQKMAINLEKGSPVVKKVIAKVAHLENEGYSFEGAEASFELLIMQQTGHYHQMFETESYRVIVEKRKPNGEIVTEAVVKVSVDGEVKHTVAEGDGPVHALDNALRSALFSFYPAMEGMRLTDFKVRVVNMSDATAAKVRVNVESIGYGRTWTTVGVSTNIIEASYRALVDSFQYGLQMAASDSETPNG